MGDIDLSNANVTDTHATLLCTLLKSHATSSVQNLDLSGNKLGDAGFVGLCKAKETLRRLSAECTTSVR